MPGVTTAYQNGVHGSRPAASSGCILYACSTHSLIYRSDGSAWSTWMTIGSTSTTVASDTIWDAAGDLAIGTGADTASKLSIGAASKVLQSDGSTGAWMRPAAERLKGYLEKVAIAAPACQVVNNVDVKVETDPARIRDSLVRQAASPVRWVETIQAMAATGATHIVECGPGKVLAGMTKRIAPGVQSFTLSDRAAVEQALAGVKG